MLAISPVHSKDEVKSEGSVTIESCTTATFVGGTTSQQTDILNAHKKLCLKFIRAKSNVDDTDFYKTWFGTYTDERTTKVINVYADCLDGILNGNVTYTINPSDCQSNWNAYTYEGSTKVYLCPAYDNKEVYCKNSY